MKKKKRLTIQPLIPKTQQKKILVLWTDTIDQIETFFSKENEFNPYKHKWKMERCEKGRNLHRD